MKIGRNQPCPCGSGNKFKHCHGRMGNTRFVPDSAIKKALELHEAKEHVRREQQGQGKPIISVPFHGHQVVTVGNTLHFSKNWKTFPDFSAHYIKLKLGVDWGNAEIAKPLGGRHPLMQWYDALCRYQKKVIKTPGIPTASDITGVVACYFGVAYGLYLLEHNVELQERLIKRLKDPGNFQGAYYELQVASGLILAGFKLSLEDETDPRSKHCEFSAISPETGKKYWVEAKMRAVVGQFGRTHADGSRSTNPLSRMIRHINGAFAKPAADERMIFVDLNAEMSPDVSDDDRPEFVEKVTHRLETYERKELNPGDKAYVFVTNSTFHRDLDAHAQLMVLPFGLGMPDFNRPGAYRLSERYRQDRQHADAYRVAEGFSKLIAFPATFDGSMSASAFHGERAPVVIGQSYVFEGAGKDGQDLVGEVGDAIVIEREKAVMVAVNCPDGTSHMLREPISDRQLADYRAHPDAYFGKIRKTNKTAKTPTDLFEFFIEAYRELPREEILKRLGGRVSGAEDMCQEDLLAIYCEGLVAMSGMADATGESA